MVQATRNSFLGAAIALEATSKPATANNVAALASCLTRLRMTHLVVMSGLVERGAATFCPGQRSARTWKRILHLGLPGFYPAVYPATRRTASLGPDAARIARPEP